MFFLASASVRPPLGDPAAVKKHDFAPKRFRKRGNCIAQPSKKMKRVKHVSFFYGRVALAVRNINNITIGANKRGAQ